MRAETPVQTLDQQVVSRWPSELGQVSAARHELRATLSRWGLSPLADSACLVLSELMTNSLKHCAEHGRRIETRFVRRRDAAGCSIGLRVEVHDAEEAWPVLREPAADEESGRGLLLVDAITGGRWGASRRQGIGKLVWAEIAGDGQRDGETGQGRAGAAGPDGGPWP